MGCFLGVETERAGADRTKINVQRSILIFPCSGILLRFGFYQVNGSWGRFAALCTAYSLPQLASEGINLDIIGGGDYSGSLIMTVSIGTK